MLPADEKNTFACVLGLGCVVLIREKDVARQGYGPVSSCTCENRFEPCWALCEGL